MIKQNRKYLAACAALLSSGPALAGTTGNVGVVSEYLFRGVSQSAGAAVQGGLDFASDIGLYAGLWGSNISFASAGGNGAEVDLYGGYAAKFGAFGIDVGAIYYWYSEQDEIDGVGAPDLNTVEGFVGGSVGPVAVKYYYSPETNFFGTPDPVTGDVEEGHYILGSLALPITDTVSFNANLGYSFGDGVEQFLAAVNSGDDKYIDYGIGVSKTLDNGLTASFSFVDTDIDGTPAPGVNFDDDPKFVVGLKKVFDI